MKNILWLSMAACLLLANPAGARYLERVIRCESNGFAPEHCRFPLAPGNAEIKEVSIIRQYSAKPCVEGKSWEAGNGGLIVTNGCRADFRVVYQTADDDPYDRHDHEGHGYRDDSWRHGPSLDHEDPTDIVMRAFAEILNRRPTREELREYRSLITRHNWSERELRRELRRRGDSGYR